MNIVMLGHSGVGKTTYMASMYGSMQSAINGFSLKAAYSSDHDRLVGMHLSIKRGYYPDLSQQREKYSFYLHHYGDSVFPFRWIDHRGGAIHERGEHSEQARLLHNDLSTANGVIVFCDSPSLAAGNIRRTGIQRLINLLSISLKNISHPMPIAIVLTKADMVADMSEEAASVLTPLLESIRASDNIVGTIIPTVCGTTIENVEIPLLFNLFIGIRLELNRQAERIDELVREAEDYDSRANIFDEIGSFFSGESSWSDLANSKIEDAKSEYYRLKQLEPSSESLGEYLQELPVF